MAPDGTAKPVSRNQILRHKRGQVRQPYTVDPYYSTPIYQVISNDNIYCLYHCIYSITTYIQTFVMDGQEHIQTDITPRILSVSHLSTVSIVGVVKNRSTKMGPSDFINRQHLSLKLP